MADSNSDNQVHKSTKSYSIWSLLVIMTLLAVWLAIPRAWNLPGIDSNLEELFFLCHQMGLWCTALAFIWLNLGKRRSVLMVCIGILVLAWGPLSLWLAESMVRGHDKGIVDSVLHETGLYDSYATFYGTIHQTLGYAH